MGGVAEGRTRVGISVAGTVGGSGVAVACGGAAQAVAVMVINNRKTLVFMVFLL
jgi:hypothetical protein